MIGSPEKGFPMISRDKLGIGIPAVGLILAAGILSGGFAHAATLDEIGDVRADTLRVDRTRFVTAALAHNEMLSASAEMVEAADGRALAGWQGFLPRASVGAYKFNSDDALNALGFSLNQRVFNPAGMAGANTPGEVEHNVLQFKIQQPVFNGGMALYGRKAATAMARSAEQDHRRAEDTIRLHAVQAYEGLVLAMAYESVMRAALESAEGHVRQARSMFDNDMVTEADLLQARVHRDALRQRLIEVRNMCAVAGEHIKLLAAVETGLPLAPAEGGQVVDAGPALEISTRGVRERADIAASAEQAKAADHMSKVARGALLPHLNLGVEKTYFSGDTYLGDDADSWTLGIYATWDIFSGFGNIGGLKAARAESRAADYVSRFKLRQARAEATQSGLELEAAREKLLVASDAVEAAREGLRIVENMYREGLASMVDLLDVQAAATMAEGNLVQARHDYRIGLARLEYSGGRLVMADGSDH